jgi:hypothetical protein
LKQPVKPRNADIEQPLDRIAEGLRRNSRLIGDRFISGPAGRHDDRPALLVDAFIFPPAQVHDSTGAMHGCVRELGTECVLHCPVRTRGKKSVAPSGKAPADRNYLVSCLARTVNDFRVSDAQRAMMVEARENAILTVEFLEWQPGEAPECFCRRRFACRHAAEQFENAIARHAATIAGCGA